MRKENLERLRGTLCRLGHKSQETRKVKAIESSTAKKSGGCIVNYHIPLGVWSGGVYIC